MRAETLKQAIAEARRFITIAGKVKIRTVNGTYQMAGKSWLVVDEYTKESASCKRASMDLTRILADLRLNR